jgi:dolichol-phosphate mannosyltransferase
MRLSLVIPTYNEKENILILVSKIQKELKENKIHGEIIIVDDNSSDGTGKIADKLKKQYTNVRVIHRKGKSGLSSAVIQGWKAAQGEVLGVMDADLSHPPEKIKELFWAIEKEEVDLSIGSRYIRGGEIKGWGIKRKIMSRAATLLARLYTPVKDPMTGFFMIRKDCIENTKLNSKGFKILLEVIVKANYTKVKEVPITFVNRTKGKSKANLSEISGYLCNIFGYLSFKRQVVSEFFKFAFVGLTGTVINLGILYFLTEQFRIYYLLSAVFAFFVAMSSNFIFNKIWTFKKNFNANLKKSYLNFAAISIFALLINLFFLYIFTEIFKVYYLASQVFAIGIALVINFLGNKIWTFSK